MAYIGTKPADKPLTAADITDSIITTAKIADGAVVNADIANSTIALAKLSATGTASASTFLRGDNSWASAGAAAGQVIQVKGATDGTQRSTSSNSFVTGSNTLSVSITPSSTSNKIFVIVNGQMQTSSAAYGSFFTIKRGATNLGNATYGMGVFNHSSSWYNGSFSFSYLDSPSTTSATTYQLYFYSQTDGSATYLNVGDSVSSITAFEIKG